MTRSTLITAALFAATALTACGGSQKTKDQVFLTSVQDYHDNQFDVDNQPISILDKRHLMTAFATYDCGNDPVHFAADSSELLPQARTQLKLVSWCIRDYRVNDLVVAPRPGSQDLQGSSELQKNRADAVAAYLQELGVDTTALRIRAPGDGMSAGPVVWTQGTQRPKSTTTAKKGSGPDDVRSASTPASTPAIRAEE